MKKKSFHKKTLGMAAAALALTAAVSAGSALAYFTTYTQAAGGAALQLGFAQTIPQEEVDNWTKHVKVQNTGDYDCFVRVRAFAGTRYQDKLIYSGDNWTLADDGYYYYSQIVEAGASTEDVLDIRIPYEESEGQDFNVIVVQESAPVIYDENGNPIGDWDHILDSTQDSYDGNEEVGE